MLRPRRQRSGGIHPLPGCLGLHAGSGTPVGKCNVGGDVTSCYCGTHPASCDQPGGPDGPCVAEITAAAGRNVVTKTTDTPTEAQIIDRQGDIDFAFGRAATVQTIAGAFCPTDCGL